MRHPLPYRVDYCCWRGWLMFAQHARRFARERGQSADNPVEAARLFMRYCPMTKDSGAAVAEANMALDLNPAARLALAGAWDAVLALEGKQ